MKAFVLSTAAAIGLGAIASPAQASVLTIGGPLAFDCYKYADVLDARSEAIESCTRALGEENLRARDEAATYINRGILYRVESHSAAAEADFDRAISIDPKLSEAWLNKGYLKLRQNHAHEALPLLEKGIALGPSRPAMAYLARGLAYEDMGDLRQAYDDLVRARDLEPAWSEPGKYLARYAVRNR